MGRISTRLRARGSRSALRRAGRQVLVHLGLAAVAVGGVVLALRAAGPSVRGFALGTMRVAVTPAVRGAVDVYIPIVDWGVRMRPYRTPLLVSLEFRSLDRASALTALRSGVAAQARLATLQQDLASMVRLELRRAAGVALIGGAAGGLLAGLLLASRRGWPWLLLGPAEGVAAVLFMASLFAVDLSRADFRRALDEPSFYARGEELPELLAFSSQLLTVSEQYTEDFDRAVAGLSNLVAAATGGTGLPEPAHTAVLASDIHANTFLFPVLRQYSRGRPVFLAGDFALLGTELEETVVPGVAALSRTVVAVSGNHDSRSLMRELARAGVIVLTREGRLRANGRVTGGPVVDVAGLKVAGFEDPLERGEEGIGGHLLEGRGAFLERAGRELLTWFAGLPERPDVVMLHQHPLAHVLLDELEAGEGPPVIILTGHDHWAHYHQAGEHLLLDGGTLGAGGPFAIGETPAGFALLHLDRDRRPLALDLIEVEPLSGQGTVRRRVVRPVEESAADASATE
ncbi:MAG: metallophosphoesterase family protein [Thermoanaerobaculia bacterium]